MRVLARTLRDRPPPKPLHAVVGILRDKDAIGMVGEIAGVADGIWLTSPPSAPGDRRPDMGALAPVLGPGVRVQADFDCCLDEASAGAQTVLVCGSFHTVGDAMMRVPGLAPFG
jgi:dihydrofolate synthase/folylpolyglutamate synthase